MRKYKIEKVQSPILRFERNQPDGKPWHIVCSDCHPKSPVREMYAEDFTEARAIAHIHEVFHNVFAAFPSRYVRGVQ